MISSSISKLKLGLFDLGILYNNNSIETIQNTLEAAVMAEKLGYSRYWIGEHQTHDVAWRSSEIILTLLGGYTKKIRIGTAGVMLGYANPLLSAQNFKLLASLFPNRVDLGFAKGYSPNNDIHERLLDGRTFAPDLLLDKAVLVKSYLNELANEHLLSGYNTNMSPQMWVLGSSAKSMDFATENNLNFSLSLCHKDLDTNLINQIHNNEKYNATKFNILVGMICSDTEQKAQIIANEHSHKNLKLSYYGNPVGCFNFLKDMQEKYATNEIIICDLCKNSKDKFNSISLLASTMET
ncbi:MAG: LLM class flavin-dependent oxidoreductase [Pedobacter sp.]|jgi:alkanesulfonate monooxygenase SsuD/methylene tetrahydromethanopterin reductase-like flavin-dependent oxidoreductase (luciferase family)|uniref:LLM class flavin-dependent oxidoreductase n=1 Tax=Pedobacter sp. TaxID=1411316 RepID=UPI00356987FE